MKKLVDITPGSTVYVVYECRDIGYGVEEGEDWMTFTGLCDASGKWEFWSMDAGVVGRDGIYLFEDEIVDLEVSAKSLALDNEVYSHDFFSVSLIDGEWAIWRLRADGSRETLILTQAGMDDLAEYFAKFYAEDKLNDSAAAL